MELVEIEKRIEQIKAELMTINEMRPGSLSQQYNVCGNPKCRCKDPENPKKHGPYNQLSYVHKRKSTSQFIQDEFVEDIRNQLTNYKRFKELTEEWVHLSIEHAKLKLKLAKEEKKRSKRDKPT